MKANPSLSFAVHATSRGFGYVLFEGPFKAHDWGTVTAKGDKVAICLRKLEPMLNKHQPAELLLETFDRQSSRRSARIAAFYRKAAIMAEAKGIEVHGYRLK